MSARSCPSATSPQTDVTARVLAERRIAEVLEAEHKLLESVFPRWMGRLGPSRRGRGALFHRSASAMSGEQKPP